MGVVPLPDGMPAHGMPAHGDCSVEVLEWSKRHGQGFAGGWQAASGFLERLPQLYNKLGYNSPGNTLGIIDVGAAWYSGDIKGSDAATIMSAFEKWPRHKGFEPWRGRVETHCFELQAAQVRRLRQMLEGRFPGTVNSTAFVHQIGIGEHDEGIIANSVFIA